MNKKAIDLLEKMKTNKEIEIMMNPMNRSYAMELGQEIDIIDWIIKALEKLNEIVGD